MLKENQTVKSELNSIIDAQSVCSFSNFMDTRFFFLMSLSGKFNCGRPQCTLIISTASPTSPNDDDSTTTAATTFAATLSIQLNPGEHGNDSEVAQIADFSAAVRVEGRVVTFEWKDCVVSSASEPGNDSWTKTSNTRRIRVHRSSGMIAPDGDGILITGALPYEAQGQSHGGYRFRLEK